MFTVIQMLHVIMPQVPLGATVSEVVDVVQWLRDRDVGQSPRIGDMKAMAPSNRRGHVAPEFSTSRRLRASQRVAWLLRVNRVLGHEERWSRAKQFAAAFRGGCWPAPASESKISRWETNLVRVPYLAIRRYEELLELPQESLVSVIDTVNRYASQPIGGPSALNRGWHRNRDLAIMNAEELLDKVTSTEIVTGSDWDNLTSILSSIPEIMLVPRSAWTDLAGRLMAEMVIADGFSWMRRFEALNRLLGHPSGQRATISVCASLAADKTNQIVVEAISAMDGTNHPDASQHILAQLVEPASDLAFYGALLACVRKTRHGHMTQAQIHGMLQIVNDLLIGPARHDDAKAIAAQLLHQLPNHVDVDLNARLRNSLVSNRALTEVLVAGRLAVETSPVILNRILAKVAARLPRELPGFHDDTLPILVDELLFNPVLDVRLYAALLIEASPYRKPVSVALIDELSDVNVVRDTNLSGPILGALRILGDADQRATIERLIVAPGLPTPTAVSAAHAIGHIPGESEERYWHKAVGHWGRRWNRDRDLGSASVLHDLVYALGMSDNKSILTMIRDDSSAPFPVRAAAAWWLGIPDQIRFSARQ